jgi:hypothetical protein
MKPKYLVCDKPNPTEGITYYMILGLGEPIEHPVWDGPEHGFKYDVSYLLPGTYTVRAVACNQWKCSLESAPLDFTVPETPSIPVGLNIS